MSAPFLSRASNMNDVKVWAVVQATEPVICELLRSLADEEWRVRVGSDVVQRVEQLLRRVETVTRALHRGPADVTEGQDVRVIEELTGSLILASVLKSDGADMPPNMCNVRICNTRAGLSPVQCVPLQAVVPVDDQSLECNLTDLHVQWLESLDKEIQTCMHLFRTALAFRSLIAQIKSNYMLFGAHQATTQQLLQSVLDAHDAAGVSPFKTSTSAQVMRSMRVLQQTGVDEVRIDIHANSQVGRFMPLTLTEAKRPCKVGNHTADYVNRALHCTDH